MPPAISSCRRVVVVGTTGSGKTTFAHALAARLGVAHIELDSLHWGPHWTEEPDDIFRTRTEAATSAPGWVADGNYHAVRDIVWPRAEMIVWLDYPFRVVALRLLRRTLARIITQHEIWHGNRESWRAQFFSRDSLFLWLIKTYHRRRRELPLLLQRPEYARLQAVRLRSPRAAARWLAAVRLTNDMPV
jgi:adenylate kinase family enzyme